MASSATPLPTVSVVVPTHGRAPLVAELATQLLHDPATTELIVVVDGVDPSTDAAVQEAAGDDGRVRLVHGSPGAKEPSHREGWARNVGVQAATSTVVLALDDDLAPVPSLVTAHATWHAGAQDIVVVGYMPVVPLAGRPSAASRLFAAGYERACEAFERDPEGVLLGLWGGNFSVRRQHWLSVLDGAAFGGVFHEDRELGLLFHRAGLRGVFDRDLRTEHRHDGTLDQCLANARLSALAQVRLERLFPDLLTEAGRGEETGAAPRLFGLWGAAVDGPAAWRATRTTVGAVVGAGARLRMDRLELLGTRVLRRLAYERGLREAARAPARSPSPLAPR